MNVKQRILAISAVVLMAVFLCFGIYGLWNYMQDKIGNLLTSDTISNSSTASITEDDPMDFNFDDSDNGDYSTTTTFSFNCTVKSDASYLTNEEILKIENYLHHMVFSNNVFGEINVSCTNYSNATFKVNLSTDYYYTDNDFENLIEKIETIPCLTIGGYYNGITITNNDIINMETYKTDNQEYAILANLTNEGVNKFLEGFASADDYIHIKLNNTNIVFSEKYEFLDDNAVIFGNYDRELWAEDDIDLLTVGITPYQMKVTNVEIIRP